MRWFRSSFRIKLAFSYLFVILFSLLLVGYFLDKRLEENSLGQIKTSLYRQAQLITYRITEDHALLARAGQLDLLIKKASKMIGSRITVIDQDGLVLAESEKSYNEIPAMENHRSRPEMQEALSGQKGESIRYSSTLKVDMLYFALPIVVEGKTVGALRVALPLVYVTQTFRVIKKAVFLSFFLALGLAFIVGSLLTRSIIEPVQKIMRSVKRFAKGDFSRKIFLDSQDELGALAATLNAMAADLQEKLKEIEVQNQHLKAIFKSMVEGIIVVDKGMRILSVNSSIEKIFQLTQAEVQGKIFLEAIRNSEIADIIAKAMETAGVVSQELSLVWPVQRVFQVNASAVFEEGQVIGCLAVIHDITQMRKLETVRSDFVANVSHELKTPLTSIKGFVETLLEGALEDKEHNRQFLEIIHEHAKRLDNLINDLLDLSYLESKEQRLKQEKVDLKSLVEKTILAAKVQLKKKSIAVENGLSDSIFAKADPQQLEQVLTNLIDNAIKFNREKGSIKIYGAINENLIKLTIEDSGIGIPPKDLPRIFERFYRVDKARSRELGGTGLGLSIVKHIVQLHSGAVGVESSEGLGSKFWFTIPLFR